MIDQILEATYKRLHKVFIATYVRSLVE